MARLFVDHLTVIDFSYLDHQRGVVGESWIVDVELMGQLDEQGMVFDFGDVKKQIKRFIDDEVDHRLLVPTASPGCKTELDDDAMSVDFPLHSGGMISHQSPQSAVLLVETESIDTQHVVESLQHQIKRILPSNVEDVRITLRTEQIDDAYYQYTHGLQKHLGQCQRIAHGHRSRIQIRMDGVRDAQQEKHWSEVLKDGYIATEAHVVDEFEHNGMPHTRLSYVAEQGAFSISLPSACLFTMPMESTVENIAAYLAKLIGEKSQSQVVVKAFEGVNKGAVGTFPSKT